MEEQDKPFWQQKSVIAGLVSLIAGVLGVFGFNVPAEVQVEIVASIVAVTSGLTLLAYRVIEIIRNRRG